MTNAENFNAKITCLSNFKKAQTIKVSLVIPEVFKSKIPDVESVYLSIRDEENNPIAGWTKSVVLKGEDNKDFVTEIHQTKLVNFFKNPQIVEFIFTTDGKLLPGIYVAKVYLIEKYLGNVKFKIGKRFWFF